MPPGNESSTSSGRFSTLRKLFTRSRARQSLPIQHVQLKSEHSVVSNGSSTRKNVTLTLRTVESLLLASEELDALTSHRPALHSLAAKYKGALRKVQKRRTSNGRQKMTAEDEQLFLRVLEPLTEAEQHASRVTWKLLLLLRGTLGFDLMLEAERNRKNETRAVVYLLLRLRLDQEYGSPATDAQKQLFKKVAELCTQFVNKPKPDTQDDAPNDITPTEDYAKDDAPIEDTAENDAHNEDTLKPNALMDDDPDHDAQYNGAPKQAGENILVVAGRFISLEFKPQTIDALSDDQEQILAEVKKLCIDYHTVHEAGGRTEIDDSYQASEDIRCLAESINKRLMDILARIEMKSAAQRQELIEVVNLDMNHFFEECRKDVRKVEERAITRTPGSSNEIGLEPYHRGSL